ncbi:MAG: PDZ domain-containing protein, partial [Omnitrophica WOR_2 bacterium]
MKTTSLRWWSSIPFILALIVLIFMGWCAVQAFIFPYDGISTLQPSGLVKQIDPSGPAYNRLREGDQILSVDNNQILDAIQLYRNKSGGDQLKFEVIRNGTQITIYTVLNKPSSKVLAERLTPLLVAFIFWLMGVGVQMFKPYWTSWRIYYLFFLSSALLLAAGDVSYGSPPWIASLFGILLWLIGPLSIHFHFNFPQSANFRGQRFVLFSLYFVAFIGSLPYLIWSFQTITLSTWFVYLSFVRALFLTLNLLGVVGLLFHTYRHTNTPGTRSKVRIVVLGGVIGAIPVVTLTILPQALSLQEIVPSSFALLILGIVPLTYGYAIFRHRLVEYEKHVNRGATYILVYSTLGAFYLVLYSGMHRLIPANLSIDPLLNTLLIFTLATIFVPVNRRVQKMVDTVFYGGWYDYRSAVRQIT